MYATFWQPTEYDTLITKEAVLIFPYKIISYFTYKRESLFDSLLFIHNEREQWIDMTFA